MRWACALLATLMVLPASAKDSCKVFKFSGEVKDGESFQRAISDNVFFFMEPVREAGRGWDFEMGATTEQLGFGYIRVVTPPYRAHNVTMIDTSYGMPAQDAASKGEQDFSFVLNEDDFKKASYAVDQLIFSGATQPESESYAQLRALKLGAGVIRIVDSEFTPGKDVNGGGGPNADLGTIRRIAFEIELVVPQSFKVPEDLHAKPAACPGPSFLQQQH